MSGSVESRPISLAICDDDVVFMPILTRHLEQIFEQRNLKVLIQCFDNPQSLLCVVKKDTDAFDVFFLDIEMPTKRGTSLSRELRQLCPACKIVFITSHNDEVYNAFHYRADGFVPKDMLEERLPSEVNHILESCRMAQIDGPVFLKQSFQAATREMKDDSIC